MDQYGYAIITYLLLENSTNSITHDVIYLQRATHFAAVD